MSKIKLIVKELGIDGWILGLTSLAAIIIGLLDFTPIINLTAEQTLQMILVAIGLVMAAIVVQTSRRATEIRDLRDLLGVTSFEILEGKDFVLHAERHIAKAKKFVLDITLSSKYTGITRVFPLDTDHYYKTIFERVQKGEISYRRVEVIFNKERLESVIFRLLVHEGKDYFIRYYAAPPEPIPVLNLMSIDNEYFYLGGFPVSDADSRTGKMVFVRNPQIGGFFESYWNTLWLSAKALNEAGQIDWEELWKIARGFGMKREEFDSMISRLKEEIIHRTTSL